MGTKRRAQIKMLAYGSEESKLTKYIAKKYFRLQETYEKVAQIHNLKKIFDTNNLTEISKVLDTIIRVNMRDVAISKSRDMRKTGTLTNIDIIQLVEKKLCFDLSEDNIKVTE